MRIRSVVAATIIAAGIAAVGAGTASAHDNDNDGFVGGGYAQEAGYAHFSNIGGPFGITEGHLGGYASKGGYVAAGR